MTRSALFAVLLVADLPAAGLTYRVTVYRFDDGHGGMIESDGATAFAP